MTRWKQTQKNSCGAAALMCAAIELGVGAIPIQPEVDPTWIVNCPMRVPNRAAEMHIYHVTSGIGGGLVDGYSLPSRIYRVCVGLRLMATAYIPRSFVSIAMTYLYPKEREHAQAVGMKVFHHEPPAPMGNQRLLKILRVGERKWWKPNDSLHYIMVRPENSRWSIMEPACGMNFYDYYDMKYNYHRRIDLSCTDTEIGILIEPLF